MRKRIHQKGCLCSQTTPDGQYYQGRQEILKKKYQKGNISKEELWAYCLMIHSHKKNSFTVDGKLSFDVPEENGKFKTITVWGKEIQVTVEEYKRHCATIKL